MQNNKEIQISENKGKSLSYGELTHEIKAACCLRNRNDDRMPVFNWLNEIKNDPSKRNGFVEVKFKSTRKQYYFNVNELPLKEGEIIAVNSSPGHDIGVVSLIGELVLKQMKKNGVKCENNDEFPIIYRKAKQTDVEKWEESQNKEHEFLMISREEADKLKLNMKIGDVECQGDGTKATFYYIADERVDFRELIKVLALRCKVRIEMKQIGARQEAGRIGGIGNCGMELCCSKWKNNFSTVSNSAAREQNLSLNPTKITGQCSKLKCCLNYELDAYLDMKSKMPPASHLDTVEGILYFRKIDTLKQSYLFSFSRDPEDNRKLISLDVETFLFYKEINKKGEKIESICKKQKEANLFTSGTFTTTPKQANKKPKFIKKKDH